MIPFFLFLTMATTFAKTIDWQSHRGARGLYPENTINAMMEGLKYPITTLEMDVVISKDHQVVVSHEPWFNEEICKVTSGRINLYKMNYEDIKKIDCGSKAYPRFPEQKKHIEHKPLLKDLIQAVEKTKSNKNYSIEIKSTVEEERDGFQPPYQEFTDLVVKTIKELLPRDRFMLQSFDFRVLKYLHEKYPEITLVALKETSYTPEGIVEELGFTPDIFSPDYTLLKDSDIKAFHEKDVKVVPWTVNNSEDIKKLLERGVDGIITDYPNLIPHDEDKETKVMKACEKGLSLFEGRCVKVPKNAHPSDQNPGWTCDQGFVQKRLACVKIKIPRHAHFLEDGKTWQCNEGYVRYRSTCKKK